MKAAATEKLRVEKLKLSSEQSKTEQTSSGSSSSSRKQNDFMNNFVSHSGSSSKTEYVPEIQTEEERIEFQRKMQEKLQAHLAAEGKLYPKPKPSPAINTATGFANDGSFLEMFKKLQEQQTMVPSVVGAMPVTMEESITAAPYCMVAAPSSSFNPSLVGMPAVQTQQRTVPVPIMGRRRGGKILKTGIVKKPKPIEDATVETPNDAWNLYLQEVKKYKNASCDADSKTRPLVK